MKNSIYSFGIAMAVLTAPASAEFLTVEQFQAISEEVFRPVIDEFYIPGIAIGVTLDGIQYYFTEGVASRDPVVKVNSETLFEVGSVSKLFNVALAALADQEGVFSLDDSVAAVMPELKGSAFENITLYDLAAHANGGLPLQVPEEITNDADLVRWLADWNPAVDPQSIRAYSNLSIGLLGRIAGEGFGGSYETAVQDRLLPLLSLEHTYISVPEDAMHTYAFGYSRKDDSAIRVTPGMLDDEAYGIKSSVSDMLRFLDAQLENADISSGIASALKKTQEARYDTEHFAQAMIWEEYQWPVSPEQLAAGNSGEMIVNPQPITSRDKTPSGPIYFNKTGSTNGFGAYVAMVPSEQIGVVVLANRNYPNVVRAQTTLELINRLIQLKKSEF